MALQPETSSQASAVSRKKSWGAGVHDADAVSDDEPGCIDERIDAQDGAATPALAPLHEHQFGSRFLPHLDAQPLCAVYMDIPNTFVNRESPHSRHTFPSRQVLLIGTIKGLYAFETSPRDRSGAIHAGHATKCTPVWTGLSVFQLSILQPAANGDDPHPSAITFFGSKSSGSSHTNDGVMLGLCSAATPHQRAGLSRLSGHSGSVLENAPALASSSASVSSHGHGSMHAAPTSENDTLAPSFGIGSGGAVSKVAPGGGSGHVKMWTLEAVGRVVAYALSDPHHEPLDLSITQERSAGFFKSGLPFNIRNSLAAVSGLKAPRESPSSRSAKADKPSSGDVTPYNVDVAPHALGAESDLQDAARHPLFSSLSRPPPMTVGQDSDEDFPPADSPRELTEHDAALRLAQTGVSIEGTDRSERKTFQHRRAKSGYSSPTTFVDPSFGDDASSTYGDVKSGLADRDKHKGCLFFATHQAPSGSKSTGTWYLALASSRGILLYEARPPRRGASQARTWVFLKELYTPMPPKAMTFVSTYTMNSPGGASLLERGSMAHSGAATKLSLDDQRNARPFWASSHDRPSTASSSTRAPTPRGAGSSSSDKHNTDLSLLVSFGKRAVIIRLSDSRVRELDRAPFPDDCGHLLTSSRSSPRSADALRPHHQRKQSSGDLVASLERMAPAKAHRAQQIWVGVDSVEARVGIVHRSSSADEAMLSAEGPDSKEGHFSSAAKWFANRPSLPRGLLRQDARGRTLDASDSDSDDADDFIDPNLPHFGAVQLQDYGHVSPASQRSTSVERQLASTARDSTPGTSARSYEGTTKEVLCELSATVTLLSRGHTTQVFPHPMPTELGEQDPLEQLIWGGVPQAVTAWSRVLGIERASSRGSVTARSLASQESTRRAQRSRRTQPSSEWPLDSDSPRPSDPFPTVNVKLSLTVLAFLPFRVEMQRITIVVHEVTLPDRIPEDAELELRSPSSTVAEGRLSSAMESLPVVDPSTRPTLSMQYNKAALDFEYPIGFLVPCANAGGITGESLSSYLYATPQSRARKHPVSRLSEYRGPTEAAGDGGAWAFSHRGGDDWRICYVGAEV
ncbi:unnamed protein product [Parajaminaea phylloscopi]